MRLLPLLAWALLPGCWALTGPLTVQGQAGGSLSVSCAYEDGFETHVKYWCKPGTIFTCADNTHIIETSEQHPVMRNGRVSIWDDRRRRVFTVTVRNLTVGDTGTYRCGVQRAFVDDSQKVYVHVSPAPASSSPLETSSPSTAGHPALTTSTSVPTEASPKEQTAEKERAAFPPHRDAGPGHLDLVTDVLTPCIVVVLLLLVLAAGVLVKLSMKRKKALAGAAVEMGTTRSSSDAGTESSLQYADINHPAAPGDRELYSNIKAFLSLANTESSYAEIRPRRRDSEEEEEAVNALASGAAPEQQDLYANLAPAPRPAEPPCGAAAKPGDPPAPRS
ncbi:CMRF35-like molecule 6 [Rhea pennata]|uniref:CMRF35-like molecule 6 n=1 Tax=Rhea pennata TaxID=8795 RepID=UPI002E25B0AF